MNTIYQEVVIIVKDYLGPAADRFVTRQAAFHLNKTPEALVKSDIPKIAEGIKVSLGMLTQDKKSAEEACQKIVNLAN